MIWMSRPSHSESDTWQLYLMTSTSGTVRITSGVEPGHESVVEQRTVVEVISAVKRPSADGVTLLLLLLSPRHRGVQTAVVGHRCRCRRLVVAGRHIRCSPQLPDVRVSVATMTTCSGGRYAVQFTHVFRVFARGSHHQRDVCSHCLRWTPRTIVRTLPVCSRQKTGYCHINSY